MLLLRMLIHERLHGSAWHGVTSHRPDRAEGTLIECPCGTRWLSRYPWDRKAGF